MHNIEVSHEFSHGAGDSRTAARGWTGVRCVLTIDPSLPVELGADAVLSDVLDSQVADVDEEMVPRGL
jgi:hypothetical protein